jgi:hypothetical protein
MNSLRGRRRDSSKNNVLRALPNQVPDEAVIQSVPDLGEENDGSYHPSCGLRRSATLYKFQKRVRFFRCDDSARIGRRLRMRRIRMTDVSTLGINAAL